MSAPRTGGDAHVLDIGYVVDRRHLQLPHPLGDAAHAKFTDIWDKGKAAVIWSETVTAPDGTPLWTQKRSIFARGEGGFGGERVPSTSSQPPERAPEFGLAIPVLPQQALLYRMCGDRNPLHSDPEFAVLPPASNSREIGTPGRPQPVTWCCWRGRW